MLIELKKYKEHGYLKATFLLFIKMFINVKYKAIIGSKHGNKEKVFLNYPKLLKDHSGSYLCISCKLCSDICPTNCLSIRADKEPTSLKEGPIPTLFAISLPKCTQCGLCADVCPTNALDLSGVHAYSDFNSDVQLVDISVKK